MESYYNTQMHAKGCVYKAVSGQFLTLEMLICFHSVSQSDKSSASLMEVRVSWQIFDSTSLCHLFNPSCWRLRTLIFATSSILILLLLHFFFSLQCRPSKGRRRGFCWCVDKYGQPLPGFDGRERGETQCYNLESKWEDGGMTSGQGDD